MGSIEFLKEVRRSRLLWEVLWDKHSRRREQKMQRP